MTQKKSTLHASFELDVSLDFLFESVEHGVLIENTNREVEFMNQFFCDTFNIKFSPAYLYLSNTLINSKKFSSQFEKFEEFEKSLYEIPKNIEIVRDEKWTLTNGTKVLRDYIPIFKVNELKGHIWVFKIERLCPKKFLTENPTELIENALHLLPGEIAIFNTEAKILFANQAYISNNEKRLWAIGKTVVQYFSYENLSNEIALNRLENIKKTIEQKLPFSWEETNVKAKQNNEYFLRTCYPVIKSNGELESVIEQSINITQQKYLERQLNLQIEQFFTTLNSLNDIVLLTDGELKLQFINKSWENITGHKLEEFKGKSVFDILAVTRYELYGKIFAILSGEYSEKKGMLAIKQKDGNEKHLQYNLQPSFSVDDSKKGILATLTDITHQHLQESKLLELVKREKELNELKTAFVNMVSHELRTPLTVISSSAEILDLMIQSGSSYDEVTVFTKQIIDEVEKMTAFMQDLLMVSKIEAGKIEINTKETDIILFVEKLINSSYNPWKDGRKVELSTKRTSKLADVDEKMLTHALQNLLQNALKYSVGKDNPKVRICFSQTYFTISVLDNGIGIPEQDMMNLFTSFFRATNTGNISGTGIGLIVTKYFTEQHKGYVAAKSIMNKGSIFTLRLPYHH